MTTLTAKLARNATCPADSSMVSLSALYLGKSKFDSRISMTK